MAPASTSHRDTEQTVLGNLKFGLSVWLKELKSLLASTARCWEIRQLEKRLIQEYANLGKHTEAYLAQEDAAEPTTEMQRSAGQVSFLKDEIARMKQD